MKFLTLLIFPYFAFASFFPQDLTVPEKDLKLDDKVPTRYLEIVSELKAEFDADVEAQGGKLIIDYAMESSKLNAYASRKKDDWHITFQGGFIRSKLVDEHIFLAILCHELGHHIGGAPYKYPGHPRNFWVVAEGQSDYFATNICLKRMLENKDNKSFVKQNRISDYAIKACTPNFADESQYYLCLRSVFITEKVGLLLHRFSRTSRGYRSKPPKLQTPDQKIVTRTQIKHPEKQCRLDTYFQGSICNESYIGNNTNCPDIWDIFSGARPRCWYAPEN